MRRRLAFRTIAASAVLAAVVTATFALLLVILIDLHDAGRDATRATAVTAAASDLETLLIDLQAGPRGFLLSGDEDFLAPWERARRDFPESAQRLEALVADPEQAARADLIVDGMRSFIDRFSAPLVATARADPERARSIVASGEGERLINALRREFTEFQEAGHTLEEARVAAVDAGARRAFRGALGGVALAFVLLVFFAAYIRRSIVAPVRRLAGAAVALGGGDLAVRVPARTADEVGDLGRAFNAMAASLAESQDELESQNAELESQNAELEAQAAEIEDQQARLESAKDELQTFFRFGELLAAEAETERLAETVLREIADFAGAEIGTLHAFDEERQAFCLLATRAVAAGSLPDELREGEGLPGRAIAEGRRVVADHGEAGLRLAAFGEDLAARREVHLPLRQGDRTHGVLSLARVGDRAFEPRELEAIDHLADQSAVALGNVLVYREARRLASLNRAVLDATRDGIRLVDLEGNIVVANAAMNRLAREALALPEEGTIYERSDSIAERTTDPDAYRAALAAIQEDPEREALDEYAVAESGRSFQRYTAPVRNESGDLIGRIFVLREVTKEREAERLTSELMATVSHELRTPLASILGFAELLVRRDVDRETGRRYLDTIYTEARRLTALIDDFLDLQRIEAGRFRLDLEPFDLAPLLMQQVEVFSGQSGAHRLDLAVGAGPLTVLGERARVAQVVANLLSNAIKYSPAGGAVRVEATRTNATVRVSVRDEGLGIPREQQHRIFQRFFRADSSDTREIGGTGLGLTVSHELIEAHGGRMGFESAEGTGSTFWFELPAALGR